MAQHDYVIDNSTGANVRADINSALQAIASNNSGSSAPSTTYALQSFANTTDSMLQLRNAANNAFVNLRKFDGTLPLPDGSVGSPSLFFNDDTNTGLFSSAADTLDISTGGTTRGKFNSSGFTATGGVTITSTGNASLILDCGTGSAGGNQLSFIDFKINGTVKSNIAVNEAASTNKLELASAGNASVHAFFDNSLKFETDASGSVITGRLAFNNTGSSIQLADNQKATFGSGQDLQIFHDGSDSFIKDTGTGALILNSNAFFLNNAGQTENMIKATENDTVEIYFDHNKKFETLSNGCQIKGQTRFAESGGTFCAFIDVFQSGTISNGGTFTAQTNNTHAGGLVTITTNRRPTGSNNKTIKIFPIVINSTSDAALGTEISGMTGSSGSSFSVVGTSQGVIVTNTSGLDQRVTVRFDITG